MDASLFSLPQNIHPQKIISPFTACVTSLAALVTAANPLTDGLFPNRICQQRIRHWIRAAFRMYVHLQSSIPFDIFMSLIHMLVYCCIWKVHWIICLAVSDFFIFFVCSSSRCAYCSILLTRFSNIFPSLKNRVFIMCLAIIR